MAADLSGRTDVSHESRPRGYAEACGIDVASEGLRNAKSVLLELFAMLQGGPRVLFIASYTWNLLYRWRR